MSDRNVGLTLWESPLDWATVEPVAYADPHDDAPEGTWAAREWTSPVVEAPFAATELIPSWNATTPSGSWLRVQARLRSDLGWTPWLTFAHWCELLPVDGGAIARATLPGQTTDAGHVATDTFVAHDDHPFSAWQVRLTGLAAAPDGPWPGVTLVAAVVAAMSLGDDPVVSPVSGDVSRELAVPRRSQRLHTDTFPQWDGGGQSWCSPTSTTMLLQYWGVAPEPDEVAWVAESRRGESGPAGATTGPPDADTDTDADVVHAVSRVFDAAYGGTGNWAFNTAYAATRGLRAHVTRLRDLSEAEAFVAAGIPLVVSASFTADELEGAGYGTQGHLLTIVGFTAEGDVVCNDPNSHTMASNDQVRVVYRRDQLERAWLRDEGGLTYVMHPAGVALPAPPTQANWG